MILYQYEAKALAFEMHKDQKCKGGEPYYYHVDRVAMSIPQQEDVLRAVAYLHDIVEDTELTIQDLRDKGFSEEILEAVDLLTKKDGQSYTAYIDELSFNPIARKVKIYDIYDNMNLSRLKNITEKEIKRFEKYSQTYLRLCVIDQCEGIYGS